MLGVFDGGGVDDILRGIRIPYAPSPDATPPVWKQLHVTVGRIVSLEPLLLRNGFLATAHSRAPPSA
jgi:hypothetical protein